MNYDELGRRLREFNGLRDQLIARGQELMRFADRGGRDGLRAEILVKVVETGEQLQNQATRILEIRHSKHPKLGHTAYAHIFLDHEEPRVNKIELCSEKNPTRGDGDEDSMVLFLGSAKGEDFRDAVANFIEMMVAHHPFPRMRTHWLEEKLRRYMWMYHERQKLL